MKKTMKILAAFVVAVLANFAIAGDGCDLTTKGEGNRKEYFCGDTSYTFPGHINFADEFIAWTNESSKGGYTFDALGSGVNKTGNRARAHEIDGMRFDTIAEMVPFVNAHMSSAAPPDEWRARRESDYVDRWCVELGGKQEARLPDSTRVDCLLDGYAVEFDFAAKWAECVGQAAFYSEMTKRGGICVLIQQKKPKKFKRFVRRAHIAGSRAGVAISCINISGDEIVCPRSP